MTYCDAVFMKHDSRTGSGPRLHMCLSAKRN